MLIYTKRAGLPVARVQLTLVSNILIYWDERSVSPTAGFHCAYTRPSDFDVGIN